ncbi:MAG TPA: alkaline phosphatase family protein [Kiritimatiellia bacterium]|nr:alkaline phosphatase family protein [Kiritimatiellia bacterium]
MKQLRKKLVVLQVAALGWDFCSKHVASRKLPIFQKTKSVFPAVTCTTQATMRTAAPPSMHGMIANGLFFRDLKKVMFWEQAASLVEGPRIWENIRKREHARVGMMFWQQSLGEQLDLVLSPRPIHKHGGGMIQDCHSIPESLYAEISATVRKSFNLMHYWGPLASDKSSEWIMDSFDHVMTHETPDLLFGYLPHLDYDLQRYGPESRHARSAASALAKMLRRFLQSCEKNNYDYVIFGDYEITPVRRGAVFPNRRLADAGLFRAREVKGMLYPDFFHYEAFAMVDHEIAHVYISDPAKIEFIRELFFGLPGVGEVWTREEAAALGLDHPNSGELILQAEPGAWFAYPWWVNSSEAPDYATHIDIHNKPGFDPCELFFGWPPPSISMNTKKVDGTHGRLCDVAWTTSLRDPCSPRNLTELASWIGAWHSRST